MRGESARARDVVGDVRADHEHVPVREVDQLQDAEDHGVAERNQRVDRAERNAVQDML